MILCIHNNKGVDKIYLTKKIRLKPTPEQEIKFRKSAGVARFVYNFYLETEEKVFKEYLNNNSKIQYIPERQVIKYINNELKPSIKWLREVGCNVIKQASKDADIAYQRYFKKIGGKPKFKSKKNTKLSFYVNYETLKKTQKGFRGEKLGDIKASEQLPALKEGHHYSNPRISYDGKYWYLTIGYEVEPKNEILTNESLGIDLGVKDLAICSNGKKYKNINKSRTIKRLKRKLKREQRKLSRRRKDSKNADKQRHKVKLIYRRITNIRNNYIHQITIEIVRTKPFRIVMEDLNIQKMLKNKHLAKYIIEQNFYEFKRQIEYKCQLYGIKFVEVPRFYPSSKMCSCCGNIKKDLKLSDRIYYCDKCGIKIDRDLNASYNLANYKII